MKCPIDRNRRPPDGRKGFSATIVAKKLLGGLAGFAIAQWRNDGAQEV